MSLGHGWHGMARLRQASFTGLAAMHTQPSTGPPGRKSKLSSFFWRHTSSLCTALLILSQRHSVSCHQLCCHGAMSWVSWVFASWMGAGRPWKLSLWFPPCGGMARRAARARRVARRRGLGVRRAPSSVGCESRELKSPSRSSTVSAARPSACSQFCQRSCPELRLLYRLRTVQLHRRTVLVPPFCSPSRSAPVRSSRN